MHIPFEKGAGSRMDLVGAFSSFLAAGKFIMALSSSSTISDALAQYNDNLSWEGDATAAANALAAIRFLLANRPARISSNNRNIDYESLETEKVQIQDYLSHASSSINRVSFTRGRALL